MKAAKTFYIGLAVFVLNTIQIIISHSSYRIIGIVLGLFLMVFAWYVGWTKYKRFTSFLGHIAILIGCFVTAFAIYQIPFIKAPLTALEVLDMPLFWGFITVFGGYCMITHSYCNCAIKMHEEINFSKEKKTTTNIAK